TLGGVSLAFFLALFVLGLASSRAGYILLFGLWIAVPFLFPFAVRSSHFFEIRYAICVVPIMLLVVARGIALLSDLLVQGLPVTKKNRRWGLGVDAFLALGIFGALSVAPIRDYYLIQKPDYRGVARYLASQVSTEDIVLADGYGYLYHDSMTVIRNLSYYLDRSAIAEMPILTVEPGLAEAVAGLDTARDGKVWAIVLSSDFTAPGRNGMFATTPFEGLAVVQLRRPSGDRYQDTLVMLRTLTGLLRAPEARFDVYLALAEFYAALGNQDEVDTLVGLATSSRPVERSAHLHLAVYHAKQGRSEDAVEEYLAYLQAPSTRPDWWREREAYWGLAVAYEQLDNLEQAVPAYKEVLQLDPSYWRAYRKLGSLYLRLGEPGEALSAYGRAVDLQPQNSNLHLVLGRAYQSLDQIEEATLAYQQAVAIDPNNNVAKAQLISLSELTGREIPHPLFRPLFRSLAGEINLLGYAIRPVALEAGRPLRVTLWWQALAPMDSDYSVFIHVLAPDGWMYAQQDSLLQHEGLPTSAWRVGLLVRGSYQLELPVEASAGSQAVLVGLYHWETGERLAVWDSEGVRAPEDAILLTEFTLEP
ncbi:MAG: tetratricopeptide repeat protein, partial [Anaerolineae bacterium]|nr:tetratricopeptide repeat protein [Anaerolineae bacterium]